MKKIVLGIAALTLSTSILGACGKDDTAKTSAEAKQEAPAQTNVKELAITSDTDKEQQTHIQHMAEGSNGMDSKRRDEMYKGVSKDNAADFMLNTAMKHEFDYKSEQPVSDYEAFLYTYTGDNNYFYTKEAKAKSEKVLADLKPLADDFLKATGEKDASKLSAIMIGDTIKLKDKGNNRYEVQASFDVSGENETKRYTITSEAVFNNVVGIMQAKNYTFKQSN